MAPALDLVADMLPIRSSKQNPVHAFAPISSDEIKKTAQLIRSQWPADTNIHFKQVTLSEPAKAEAIPYIEAEFGGKDLPRIDRKVFVTYYIRNTVCIGCSKMS